LEEIKKSGDYEHRRSMFYKLMYHKKIKKSRAIKMGGVANGNEILNFKFKIFIEFLIY